MSIVLRLLQLVTCLVVFVRCDFELRCHPPRRNVEVYHLQDVSPSMTNSITFMKENIFEEFDLWMHDTFSDGYTSGLAYFTGKPDLTDVSTDVCFREVSELTTLTILSSYDRLPMGVGSDAPYGGVLEALYGTATNVIWQSIPETGRRIVFVYTDKTPELLETDLPPFNVSDPLCSATAYPSVEIVKEALQNNNYHYVVLVVPIALVDQYKSIFAPFGSGVVVVPDTESHLLHHLYKAVDEIYCCPHSQELTEPVIPEPMPPVIIEPTPTCFTNTLVQLVHIQDKSWSYSNDIQSAIAAMETVFNKLRTVHINMETAVVSFIDKPLGDIGYPGDYCYREDLIFTKLSSDGYVDTLNSLTSGSGRDWKESQLDAIKGAILSRSLGWANEEDYKREDNKLLTKYIILFTDSGPHVNGDYDVLPTADANTFDCDAYDYPTAHEIAELVSRFNIRLTFFVSPDILKHWTDFLNDTNIPSFIHPTTVLNQNLEDNVDIFIWSHNKGCEELGLPLY